jgi:hypothetical protein
MYSFWYYPRMSLLAGVMDGLELAVNPVKRLLMMSEDIPRNM